MTATATAAELDQLIADFYAATPHGPITCEQTTSWSPSPCGRCPQCANMREFAQRTAAARGRIESLRSRAAGSLAARANRFLRGI